MHCPNCGSEAPVEQKFCRSCGFGLGKVARLIAEQASDENLDSASAPKEETSKKLRYFWFSFFLTVFLTFNAYFFASDEVGVFWGVGFIVLLLLSLTFGIYIGFVSKTPGDRKSPRPASSTKAPTTKKLSPQPGLEMNASVTEQTTANLAEKIEN